MDNDEVQTQIFLEALSCPGYRNIALGVWKAWAPIVKKLAKDDASISEKLLSFIPVFDGLYEGDLDKWVSYLDKVGLVKILTQDVDTPEVVRWLEMALPRAVASDWYSDDETAALRGVIAQMTQLRGTTVTVKNRIDVWLLEALLVAGAVPRFSTERGFKPTIILSRWPEHHEDIDLVVLTGEVS